MTAQTISERAGARNISAVGALDLSGAWRLAVIAVAVLLGLAWAFLASQRLRNPEPDAPAAPAPESIPNLAPPAETPAPHRAPAPLHDGPITLGRADPAPAEETDPFAGVEVLTAAELAAISQAR